MRVLLFFVFACCCKTHAQDSTIIIKAGTSFNESVPVTDLYEYAKFVSGKVFFRSGDSTIAIMNYHRFLDAMQFIDRKGDTLNIANPGTIKFIRINNDQFYYDDGYVKLLKENNTTKLAVKQTIKLSGRSKMGGYDMANPTSAIDSYDVLVDPINIYKLVPREEIILTKKTQYYIGDKYNHFVLASKKSLLRQYSKQEGALSAYIKENNVDFNNRQDLEKLFLYLASL